MAGYDLLVAGNISCGHQILLNVFSVSPRYTVVQISPLSHKHPTKKNILEIGLRADAELEIFLIIPHTSTGTGILHKTLRLNSPLDLSQFSCSLEYIIRR